MEEVAMENQVVDAAVRDIPDCTAGANDAAKLVRSICEMVGPGLPGTEQERERAKQIRQELQTYLGAEAVTVEEFPFAPGSVLGFQRFGALFTLLAVLLNLAAGSIFVDFQTASIAAAAASLLFAVLPGLLFVFQFILAREVMDRLFPQESSVNVIGRLVRPGTQTVRRLLMVSGHHDSAWEDNLLLRLRYGFYFASLTLVLGMIALPVMSLIQLVGAITGNAAILDAGTLGWLLLVYPIGPSLLFGFFWHQAGKGGGNVPGAVDNLSGSALTVAIARLLVENPALIPEDTEVRFLSFGAEEAGLRGSRRYVARHLEELQRLDARLINIEMVAYPQIAIMTSDINGTLVNAPQMVKSVVSAAERAGVPYTSQPAYLGVVTDAGPFSRAGLKALTLIPFQIPQQQIGFYHQRWDGPDKLTIPPMENVIKLALEWIRCGGE